MSPYHNFTQATELIFRARVNAEYYHSTTQLEVRLVQKDPYAEMTQTVITALPLSPRHEGLPSLEWKEFLDSENSRSAWREETICVPPGEFSLIFFGTQGESSLPSIYLDYVELADPCDNPVEGKWSCVKLLK